MFLISCSSKNFSLVCDGKLLADIDEKTYEKSFTYIFKDGGAITPLEYVFNKSECEWTKDHIYCTKYDKEYDKKSNLILDRVTGIIQDESISPYNTLNSNPSGYRFDGKCEKGSAKQKF